MDPDRLLTVLHEAAAAIAAALDDLGEWGEAGTRAGQYHSDLAADVAGTAVLERAGLGWLSEESGRHHDTRDVTVVLDPLDGSTNAHRGVPWYATSLCAVDSDGPLVAVVVDLARGRTYEAVRGGGARLDGHRIEPSGCRSMSEAFVALSGQPSRWLGWRQYRALGAAALDLCAVADGTVDAYIDCSPSAHGPWDYLGGWLVCQEAGAGVADAFGRDVVVLGHRDRRTPVAGATQELLDAALEARRALRWPEDPSGPDARSIG